MRILRAIAVSIAVLLVSTVVIFAGVRLREVRTSDPVVAASPSPVLTASARPTPAIAATPSATTTMTATPTPRLASPQPSRPPTPPVAPCPQPIPTAAPSQLPNGVASVLRLPGSTNLHLSPDGRFIEVDSTQTFVYDLTGRAVACLTGESSRAEGWLPDSSAVLIRVAKTGGRDLSGPTEFALLGVDNRITRLGVAAPGVAPSSLAYWTSDARRVAVADGTGLKITSLDTKVAVTVDTSTTVAPGGWLDDQHLLYYQSGPTGYSYRIADLSGVTVDAAELNARKLGYATLAAPDGKSAVLMATGPSSPIFSALITSNGAFRELDIQMIFGWNGPHELIARHGGSLVAVDVPTGAMRTIGSVDPDLSFPLFASPRGPLPYGAAVGHGLVCWHNSGPALAAMDLVTGKQGSVVGPGTVVGMTADGRCLVTGLNESFGLVDARILIPH